MKAKLWRTAVAMACVCASAPAAHAQSQADKAQARELGERGYSALDRGDWTAAQDLFRRAEALYHAPTLLFGLAHAEVRLGHFVEATEHYQRMILEGPPPGASAVMRKAIEEAKRAIEGVKKRRARITVTVRFEGARPRDPATDALSVTLDDAKLANDALGSERHVNPGSHRIEARAPGYTDAIQSVSLAEGEHTAVALTLEPAPVPPASPTPHGASLGRNSGAVVDASQGSAGRTLAYVALGVSGAALATSAIFGVVALRAKGSVSDSPCAAGPCEDGALDAYRDDRARYYTAGAVSTAGFAVFAAAGIAGGVLLLTAPSATARPAMGTTGSIAPYVGAGNAGVVGRF
ncbi:hypothetical protein [Pendulispora albinea]|uniref:PEGA domain-containing protein n=1 Tax=Pendulispora albinea TaxID=2741071 RepID=A0ABZ2M8V8_9BACT